MRIPSSRCERTRLQSRHSGRRLAEPWVLAGVLAVTASVVDVGAKTPGSTYCFYGTCHRVKSIAETEALVGSESTIPASFYDSCKRDRYNPCGLTSSGEPFDPDQPDNAASPIYPDGTKLLVWSPETKAAVILRVNNAGPYWGGRKLDVSRAVAEKLGFAGRGVANLQVRVIDAPTREEATYRKNRRYDPVPGYIGDYATTAAAHAGMTAVMAVASAATSLVTPQPQDVVALAKLDQAFEAEAGVAVAAAEPNVGATPKAELTKVAMAEPVTVAGTSPGPVAATETARAADADDEAGTDRARTHRAKTVKNRQVASAKARNAKAVRLASAEKAKAGAAKSTQQAKATVVAALAKPAPMVADAPNDMSMFSRHAPITGPAPAPVLKQAAAKAAAQKSPASKAAAANSRFTAKSAALRPRAAGYGT